MATPKKTNPAITIPKLTGWRLWLGRIWFGACFDERWEAHQRAKLTGRYEDLLFDWEPPETIDSGMRYQHHQLEPLGDVGRAAANPFDPVGTLGTPFASDHWLRENEARRRE